MNDDLDFLRRFPSGQLDPLKGIDGLLWVINPDHSVEPVSLERWVEWMRETSLDPRRYHRLRRVARTKLPQGVTISTVFLMGANHSFRGPPLLFETMVFGGDLNHVQDRYSSWDEAVTGHRKMVERVRLSFRIAEEVEDLLRERLPDC